MAAEFEWDTDKEAANLGRPNMSKRSTFARIRRDGRLVRVKKDGREELIPVAPLAPRTVAEIEATALTDPDAQPLTDADFKRMRRVPRVKTLRRALGFTQEEFAVRYQIPLGTLRDWEQGRTEPDQPARAYLKIIARDPERVHRMLNSAPG
jgi:putative transcriptional regulator